MGRKPYLKPPNALMTKALSTHGSYLQLMPGNYQRHLDDFGFCTCGSQRSGVEPMMLESQDEWGRYTTERVPACADCFGLL